MKEQSKEESTFFSALKDFLKGYLKPSGTSGGPVRCIGCGRCGPGKPCVLRTPVKQDKK
jgi:hypothetical protein